MFRKFLTACVALLTLAWTIPQADAGAGPRRVLLTQSVQPEVKDYVARVNGNIAPTVIRALNTLVTTAKAGGCWGPLIEVDPVSGTTPSAALVKLKYAPGTPSVLTNTNFVAGDYSQTSGYGNATVNTNKFLSTGVTFDGLGLTYTNFSFGLFAISASTSAAGYLMSDFHDTGTGDATIYIGTASQGANGTNVVQSAIGSNARLVSANATHYYGANAGLLQNQSTAVAVSSFTSATDIQLFRRTINGVGFYTFGKTGTFYIARYMTEAQGQCWTSAVNTYENTVRVLPSSQPWIMLGDSIELGTGAANSTLGWAAVVTTTRTKTQINFGVSSSTTTGVATAGGGWAVPLIGRYAAVTSIQPGPAKIFVMIGSNDCALDVSTNGNATLVATYQTGLTTILTNLAAWYGAGNVYAVSPQWNQAKNTTFNGLWNAGMSAAASAAGVTFIDYYTLLMAQTLPSTFNSDSLHPNSVSQTSTLGVVNGGHGLIAALVLSVVP